MYANNNIETRASIQLPYIAKERAHFTSAGWVTEENVLVPDQRIYLHFVDVVSEHDDIVASAGVVIDLTDEQTLVIKRALDQFKEARSQKELPPHLKIVIRPPSGRGN